MYVRLYVVSVAVVVQVMRREDFVDVFSVGDECLWSQGGALWHAATQVDGPGDGTVDMNC